MRKYLHIAALFKELNNPIASNSQSMMNSDAIYTVKHNQGYTIDLATNFEVSHGDLLTTTLTQSEIKFTTKGALLADGVNTHPYRFLINPVNLCSSNKMSFNLLILVTSKVSNYIERLTIRSTWGSDATVFNNKGDVRLAFLLGYTRDKSVQTMVHHESDVYSDIIQENFLDTYRNLTLKSVMLLKWVSKFCENVRFVMKTDDDMYINIRNLLKMIYMVLNQSNIMIGYLFTRVKPDRKRGNKWYVSQSEFPDRVYPKYLSGTGYVMSRHVVPKLYQFSLNTRFLTIEDIFVSGVLASKAKVTRKHNSMFSIHRRKPSGCSFLNAISGHHVTVKEMETIWKELKDPSLKCKRKKELAAFQPS
ncbi:beta-1,3-galactosyltransferase 1-like [Tachypleus tridentatus]|uniref:beta-1,3-galactosyltransferase 1-like n=1 Tax=Tachypleus tridentatus TaxID=6853 RepID=UPI003FD09829